MVFYNALLSLKLNGSFYKITVPFLREYSQPNNGIEIGSIRSEEYDNQFIADDLNINGVLRTPLSNKIEKYILESFLSSEISKKILNL